MRLNRRYARNIRENLSFYISATVLTVVTLLLYFLFNIAGNAIRDFGSEFFERNKVEDAHFSTYMLISSEEISELEEEYHLTLEPQRYINIETDGVTARVFSRTNKVDRYEITVGKDVVADDEVVISEGYAVENGISIGERLKIGEEEYKVTGFMQRPDYLYMLENEEDSYKNVTTFYLCYMSDDAFERLNVVSSTQVPFHVRRMVANALEIPKAKIRIVKPRIGGGFGAKQTGCCEIFTGFVTWKLKRPSYIVYSREETFTASNSRHEMKMHVKIGAKKNGEILAIDLHTLSNTGAYGEHGSTTVGLSGHKSLPLYNHVKASRFTYDVVYTNTMQAGAYRGYGATQGQFAVESAVNELADALHMDPCELRFMNIVGENEIMSQYYNEHLNSCALDRCLKKAMEMIGWKEKQLCRDMGNKRRGLGVALSMQGSGIANVDIASVIIKLQDDGFYTLSIGATDMGTGCDTILAQMAAECLDCEVEQVVTQAVDTDASPYDTGSYASATTYVTGMAVVKACEELKQKIINEASILMEVPKEHICFDGELITAVEDKKQMSLKDFANTCFEGGKGEVLIANASHCSPTSPPPFMVGIAEVDVDKLTGEISLVDYVSVVDCGTVINTNLAKIQAEGGIAQGIGMALYEDISYSKQGKMRNRSFLQYKIPTRLDVGTIRVDFESSYEDHGPFGAKSIGEVVINTPAPAIASAIAHASGVQIRTLPITAEKILLKKDED